MAQHSTVDHEVGRSASHNGSPGAVLVGKSCLVYTISPPEAFGPGFGDAVLGSDPADLKLSYVGDVPATADTVAYSVFTLLMNGDFRRRDETCNAVEDRMKRLANDLTLAGSMLLNKVNWR